jgi:hypothetical protein
MRMQARSFERAFFVGRRAVREGTNLVASFVQNY